MPDPRRRVTALIAILVFALALVACDSSGDASPSSTATTPVDTTDSVAETTTSTEAPLTSLPEGSIPGTASPSIPADVAAEMRSEIGVIMLEIEESRGLPFLEIPTVTILDEADFTVRVNQTLEEDIDEGELAHQEALFKLLGMLEPDDDLRSMLIALYTEAVAGFYSPDTGEMVVPVARNGITPLQRMTIAHELVHALTDQHFDIDAEYERRIDEGTGDDVAGMLALIEGDATYQQLLYLESMDTQDAVAATLESLAMDRTVMESMPTWMQRDLAFPYEQGLVFAGHLVRGGGLKAMDEAYQDPPTTTEQILDPNKYLRQELPLPLPPLTVELGGWTLEDEATFGEWGTRLLLMDTLSPGALVQAAAGWGNDTYRLFTRGSDTAFVWSYLAESEDDAEDLTNGLISHTRGAMGASGGREVAGGLLFDGGSPVVFIDRIDDAIFYIASTDAAAVESARQQLGI